MPFGCQVSSEPSSPADGSVLDCMSCTYCDVTPFVLKWEWMCKACSYDIEITDEDGNVIETWADEEISTI